jgi:hypothetical protein
MKLFFSGAFALIHVYRTLSQIGHFWTALPSHQGWEKRPIYRRAQYNHYCKFTLLLPKKRPKAKNSRMLENFPLYPTAWVVLIKQMYCGNLTIHVPNLPTPITQP